MGSQQGAMALKRGGDELGSAISRQRRADQYTVTLPPTKMLFDSFDSLNAPL